MKSIARFKGTIYPDKSLSIGCVPRKKKRHEDARYAHELSQQEPLDLQGKIDFLTGASSIEGKFMSTSERSPLFIESPKSSRKPRGAYGQHGITGFGKKFVRNSAILLERKYGKRRLGFVTCTLPHFPEEIQRRINSVWGEIVRRFYQKIGRHLQKLGHDFEYVGVTEIQEKRYMRTGIPVPHLHFVYLCKGNKSDRYYMYICQIHRSWNHAVREGIAYSGYPLKYPEHSECGSVHAKVVKKSVAAYLGKYVSKGCEVLQSMKDNGWTEFPKQWWNADTKTKLLYKSALVHLDTHTCSHIFYNCAEMLAEGDFEYLHYIYVEVDGTDRCLGLYAKLSSRLYEVLKE